MMNLLFGNQQNRSKTVTYGNGLLYNWYAVSQANFAPAGWHVPTQEEFTTLIATLGGASVAGGKMKSTRTGLQPGWNSPNTGADDSSGFRAFASGRRTEAGIFDLINQRIYIWQVTGMNETIAYYLRLMYDTLTVVSGGLNKKAGFSVRLLKDTTTWSPSEVLTDYDGNLYATVQIGTQVWLKSNWKCTKYNDGTPIPFAGSNGVNYTAAEWQALTTPGLCSYNNAAIIEYTEKFPL